MSNSTPTRRFLVRFADGTQVGPLDKAAIQSLVKNGRMMPQDSICQEGKGKWVLAGSVRGLFDSDVRHEITEKRLFVRFADGSEVGPLTPEAVQKMLTSGKIQSSDSLRLEDSANWIAVSVIESKCVSPRDAFRRLPQLVLVGVLIVASVLLILGATAFIVRSDSDRSDLTTICLVAGSTVIVCSLMLKFLPKTKVSIKSHALVKAMTDCSSHVAAPIRSIPDTASTPRQLASELTTQPPHPPTLEPLPIKGFRRAHVYGIIYLAYFAGVFYLLRGGFSFGAFASAESNETNWFAYGLGCIPGGLAGIFGLCFLGGWMDSACPRCRCLSGRLVDSSEAIGQVYGSTTEQQTATHKDRFGHPLGTTTYDVTVPTVTTVLVHACHCRYCNHRWKDASKETSRA